LDFQGRLINFTPGFLYFNHPVPWIFQGPQQGGTDIKCNMALLFVVDYRTEILSSLYFGLLYSDLLIL
jgi:hypothetical protein